MHDIHICSAVTEGEERSAAACLQRALDAHLHGAGRGGAGPAGALHAHRPPQTRLQGRGQGAFWQHTGGMLHASASSSAGRRCILRDPGAASRAHQADTAMIWVAQGFSGSVSPSASQAAGGEGSLPAGAGRRRPPPRWPPPRCRRPRSGTAAPRPAQRSPSPGSGRASRPHAHRLQRQDCLHAPSAAHSRQMIGITGCSGQSTGLCTHDSADPACVRLNYGV